MYSSKKAYNVLNKDTRESFKSFKRKPKEKSTDLYKTTRAPP